MGKAHAEKEAGDGHCVSRMGEKVGKRCSIDKLEAERADTERRKRNSITHGKGALQCSKTKKRKGVVREDQIKIGSTLRFCQMLWLNGHVVK